MNYLNVQFIPFSTVTPIATGADVERLASSLGGAVVTECNMITKSRGYALPGGTLSFICGVCGLRRDVPGARFGALLDTTRNTFVCDDCHRNEARRRRW